MEWVGFVVWMVAAVLFAVPMAMLLVLGALVAVFPSAIAASAILRLLGDEPSRPIPCPEVVSR